MIDAIVALAKASRWRLPGTQVIERPGWSQTFTPSVRDEKANEITLSVADDPAAVVAEERARYAQVSLKWLTGPWTRPVDFARYLAPHAKQSWRAFGMQARVCDVQIPESANVTAEETTDLELYLRVSLQGWGNTEGALAAHEQLRRDGTRFFVARYNNEPVGAAAFNTGFGYAFLTRGVVLPHARGRGVYRALVAKRLQVMDVPMVSSWARAHSSAPLLERMGFSKVFESEVFVL